MSNSKSHDKRRIGLKLEKSYYTIQLFYLQFATINKMLLLAYRGYFISFLQSIFCILGLHLFLILAITKTCVRIHFYIK